MKENNISDFCIDFPDKCITCILNDRCLRYRLYNIHGWDKILYEKQQNTEMKKMTNINEMAMAYEPKQTKNICDLEAVPSDIEVKTKIINQGTKEEFSYMYIEHNDEQYRLPTTVLKQLKAQLEIKPVKLFRVTKKGEGLKTEYTVIVLD